MSHGTLLVLEPLRQTNADLKSANEVLVLIHEMVLAYCSTFLMATSCAKRLGYIKHSFPAILTTPSLKKFWIRPCIRVTDPHIEEC